MTETDDDATPWRRAARTMEYPAEDRERRVELYENEETYTLLQNCKSKVRLGVALVVVLNRFDSRCDGGRFRCLANASDEGEAALMDSSSEA